MQPIWIEERIVSSEETPLTKTDIATLREKIKKQVKLFLPAYLLLIGIAVFFLIYGPESVNIGKSNRLEITDEFKHNFWIAAPYVSAFIVLMSTFYFGKYYVQNVQPLIKDVRSGKKKLIFFKPLKTEMAFFKRYYLGTPIFDNQQIQIAAEDFFLIQEDYLLCLELGANSRQILRLLYGEKEINYW